MITNKLKFFNINWSTHTDGPGQRVAIYLQGCNLTCDWCHSPHSQGMSSPLLFFESLCQGCKLCLNACPYGVHEFSRGIHILNRSQCQSCGRCIGSCPQSSMGKEGALSLPTKEESVQKLFDLVEPQLNLFRGKGGITFSGGEPLLQIAPLREMAALCKNNGHHTVIETSGTIFCAEVNTLLPLIDTWLVGLRIINGKNEGLSCQLEVKVRSLLHRIRTSSTSQIVVRIPVVPGYTDTPQYLCRIRQIINDFEINSIELLPLNPNTNHFYKAIGINCRVKYSKDETDRTFEFMANYLYPTNINSNKHLKNYEQTPNS